MTAATYMRRLSLVPAHQPVIPTPPRRMVASSTFRAEAHNIANLAMALARKVDGQTTDAAIRDARLQMKALAARLVRLSEESAR